MTPSKTKRKRPSNSASDSSEFKCIPCPPVPKETDPAEVATTTATTSETTPAYASKQYWEDRYKRIKKTAQDNSTSDDVHVADDEQEPDPFHAWYFTYDELSPLILPIIIGDKNIPSMDEEDDSEQGEEEEESGCNDEIGEKPHTVQGENKQVVAENTEEEEQEEGETEQEEGDANTAENDATSLEEIENEEWEEVGDDNEEEEEGGDDEPPERLGLAKDGPIEILEVGCGDVPLGGDIRASIVELASREDTAIVANEVVKRVICLDYSDTVIQNLQKQAKEQKNPDDSFPVEYECADARELPFQDKRFAFILEKGTLDAMLSDADRGPRNCRAIVTEMARVLTIGGCIMVISHLNAQCQKGLDWLETIVMPGLQRGGKNCEWEIEIHGNERSDGTGDELGPAVYVMHKYEPSTTASDSDKTGPPRVSLRFFSY